MSADPNPERGEVPIVLDRPRVIKITIASHRAYHERFGKSAQLTFHQNPMAYVDWFLWASLVHEDPTLDPSDMDRLIDCAEGETLGDKLDYICGKLVIAQTWSQPTQTAPGSGEKKSPKT